MSSKKYSSSVSLEVECWERLKEESEKQDRSVSFIVNQAVREYLKLDQKEASHAH